MNFLPSWTNQIKWLVAVVGGYLGTVVLIGVWYGFSPKTTDVGYRPEQPIPFSHALHAGKLGMDCRYCHQTVERAANAAVPTAETCMGCHARVLTESAQLAPLRKAWADGGAISWKRVHDLPDYAYFDHSAHLNAGVGCQSCHGRIDQMEVVSQVNTLSMGWCIECHRNPAPHIRPPGQITAMVPDERWSGSADTPFDKIHAASTDCSTCHR
jgi:menaquinone reductase, multiheme cytochrome c subunit